MLPCHTMMTAISTTNTITSTTTTTLTTTTFNYHHHFNHDHDYFISLHYYFNCHHHSNHQEQWKGPKCFHFIYLLYLIIFSTTRYLRRIAQCISSPRWVFSLFFSYYCLFYYVVIDYRITTTTTIGQGRENGDEWWQRGLRCRCISSPRYFFVLYLFAYAGAGFSKGYITHAYPH